MVTGPREEYVSIIAGELAGVALTAITSVTAGWPKMESVELILLE
jgi:hypothetical protein